MTPDELAAIEARDAADYERLGQGAFWHQSHIDRRVLLAALRTEQEAHTPYRDLNEHIAQSNAGTHLFDPACYFCTADAEQEARARVEAALRQIEALRTAPNRQGSPVSAFMDGVRGSAVILRAALAPAASEIDPGLEAIAGHICPTCKRSRSRRLAPAASEGGERE